MILGDTRDCRFGVGVPIETYNKLTKECQAFGNVRKYVYIYLYTYYHYYYYYTRVETLIFVFTAHVTYNNNMYNRYAPRGNSNDGII